MSPTCLSLEKLELDTPRARSRLKKGRGPYILQVPTSLGAAKNFLSSLDMVRLCGQCHLYITGAPDPSLDHSGSISGSLCVLPHHPAPCPFIDAHDNPCNYEDLGVANLDDVPVTVPSAANVGATVSELQEVFHLQEQLQRLQRERDDERRRAELLQLANDNLQSSHARLSQAVAHSGVSSLGAFGGVPATTTSSTSTTTSTVSCSTTPRMGTGFSSSLVTPRTFPPTPAARTVSSACLLPTHPRVAALGGAISSLPASLSDAVSNHVVRNTVSVADVPSSIPGYGGPTVPDLRRDPEANALAQRAMDILLGQIPALAPAPSVPQQAPGSVSRNVPGALFPPVPGLSNPRSLQNLPPPASVPSGWGMLSRPVLDPQQARLDLLQQQLDELQLHPGQGVQESFHHHQDIFPQEASATVSLDSLASRTIKCKQYKAVDFAKLGTFPYSSQIKQANLNLSLFSYGSLRHILYLIDGTLPPVKPEELCARLQHLINVFEIVSLSSSITDFDNNAWKIGKEYDARIISDLELGIKQWCSLDRAIDPTAWQFAKELVGKSKPNQSQSKSQGNSSSTKLCTTWNTFKRDGCHYKFTNPGEVCVFQHVCSKCRKNHKAWQCPNQSASNSATAPVSSAPVTPVTSV